MKIIIRNRNKKIEVSNITSKGEMVWISPEQLSEITTDAGVMATEFMKKHPQMHEVKFSVLPELDKDEDEDEFYANDGEAQKPRVVIIGEEKLQSDLDEQAAQYPDDHWTMEQVRERLTDTEQTAEGITFGDSVSKQNPDLCHWYECVCLTQDVAVYLYKGTYKG